jgi:hypothetical protein
MWLYPRIETNVMMKDNEINSNRVNYVYIYIYIYSSYEVYMDNAVYNISNFEEKKTIFNEILQLASRAAKERREIYRF